MKDNIKLYFIDLDGTALDTKKGTRPWVSASNLNAIKEARDAGKKVIVSTGRIGLSMEAYKELLKGEYFILGNGSRIENDKGEAIFESKLSVNQVLKVLDIAQRHKMVLKLSEDYNVYGVRSKLERFITKKLGFKEQSGYTFDMTIERYKILLWGKASRRKMKRINDELNKEIDGLSAVMASHGFVIEVTTSKATKGLANAHVAKLLGIPREQTAHVGNTMNDATTKGYVEELIAVKDASKSLRKIADYIGPKHKKGGMGKILKGQYKKNH